MTVRSFVFSRAGRGRVDGKERWERDTHETQALTPKVVAGTVQGPGVRCSQTVLPFNKPVCRSPVLR